MRRATLTDEVPIVLVHGQLMTDEVWAPVLPHLGAREIIIADVTSDDSIAAMAQRLLDTAPTLFDLVGYAMGGFVAFEVLRVAPERVRRLVLVSTLADADNDAQRARRQGYADHVAAGRFADIAAERVPILLSPEKREELGPLVYRMARETGSHDFLVQQTAILTRVDSRPSLAEIACPTLIIHGRHDAIAVQRHQDDMRRGIAQAEYVELDCGHLVTLEQPEQLAALISEKPFPKVLAKRS